VLAIGPRLLAHPIMPEKWKRDSYLNYEGGVEMRGSISSKGQGDRARASAQYRWGEGALRRSSNSRRAAEGEQKGSSSRKTISDISSHAPSREQQIDAHGQKLSGGGLHDQERGVWTKGEGGQYREGGVVGAHRLQASTKGVPPSIRKEVIRGHGDPLINEA